MIPFPRWRVKPYGMAFPELPDSILSISSARIPLWKWTSSLGEAISQNLITLKFVIYDIRTPPENVTAKIKKTYLVLSGLGGCAAGYAGLAHEMFFTADKWLIF